MLEKRAVDQSQATSASITDTADPLVTESGDTDADASGEPDLNSADKILIRTKRGKSPKSKKEE